MKHPDTEKHLHTIAEALKRETPLAFEMAAMDAYMLTAMLNLGTRHPHISGATRLIGQRVGRRIERAVTAITNAPPSYQLIEFADDDLEAGRLLAEAFTDAPAIQVACTFHEVFCTITLLQLILRHPDLPDRLAAGAEEIGRQFQTHLSQAANCPEIDALLETGWHPEFDVDQAGNPVGE